MAGPCINILITLDAQTTWRSFLAPFAIEWDGGGSCWIPVDKTARSNPESNRPFIGSVDRFGLEVSGCEYSAAEIDSIEQAADRHFTHSINLCAMCNQDVDHRLLCTTAGKIALDHDGIVDFGVLDAPIEELGMTKCEWVYDEPPYWQQCWTIIGDSCSCDRWLEHERFRMLK